MVTPPGTPASIRGLTRWNELAAELDALLELGPAERAARLARVRDRDADLGRRLEDMLAQDALLDAAGFLTGTALPAATMATLAGMRVGSYTLLRVIGEGGMGTVWLAARNDGRFEGHAAVKLLNLALLGDSGLARFTREGRILGRLAHPNIARLLDAGVMAGGQPYLVLEHVEGESIDRDCDARGLDVTRRVERFLDVLEAVAYAHRNLVLHRDLKPSNVLVTPEGRVKLLDFGIAKLLNEEDARETADLTRIGGRAYTPEYAAPEQVRGDAATTATDVYALGVMLYVLLCGRHPTTLEDDGPMDRLRAVVERDPPRMSAVAERADAALCALRGTTPRGLAHRLRGDLDVIVARALKKEPAERYPGADALADDLRRHLRQQPVHARPDTLRYRASKFVRRNRMPVALATFAALALVGGFAGTLTQAHRATLQAERARDASARADREARAAGAQRDFALRQLSRAEAINDLNQFLLADAAPSGKPLNVGELLARAERIVERAPNPADDNRVAMLVELGAQYKFLDRDDKSREVLARAYDASRKVEDASVRAGAACTYAWALASAGEHARAEALFEGALAELPDEPQYTFDRVKCYYRGTVLAELTGNGSLAIQRAEAAERLLAHLSFASPAWQLRVLMNVGESYRIGSRYDDAIAAFERAAQQLAAQSREDTETASTLYNNWGLALYAAGRTLDAEVLFQRAMANSNLGTGADVSPMLLLNYARTLDRLDRRDGARLAAQAYDAARAAGDAFIVHQAALLRAVIERGLGHLDQSARWTDEAEAGMKRVLPPDHVGFAVIAMQRASLAELRGRYDVARGWADRAVALFEGNPHDRMGLPDALRRRATLLVGAGDIKAARADAQRAVALEQARASSGRPSCFLGMALAALALVEQAAGNRAAERAAAQAAVEQLRPTLGADHPDTRAAARLLASF